MPDRTEKSFTDDACRPFLLEGSAAAEGAKGVLLLHGFTGTIAHMRPLADRLHALGFTVLGFNLPGHATRLEDMAAVTWADWLEAAKDGVMRLRGQCSSVSVAGLSMGGCLALLLAEQMEVDAVAAISTPMGTRAPLWLAPLAAPFVPTVHWRSRAHLDDRYDYGYAGFPTRSGAQLAHLIRMARRDLHAVTCPLLVVQSRGDRTITADSADVILRGAGSGSKSVLWLESVPHVCTLTEEAEHIADAVGEHFLRAAENAAGRVKTGTQRR